MPPWIEHNETYLYLHDGLVHHYLGLQREAISAFEKIKSLATTTETGRVEAVLDQVEAQTTIERLVREALQYPPRIVFLCNTVTEQYSSLLKAILTVSSSDRFPLQHSDR